MYKTQNCYWSTKVEQGSNWFINTSADVTNGCCDTFTLVLSNIARCNRLKFPFNITRGVLDLEKGFSLSGDFPTPVFGSFRLKIPQPCLMLAKRMSISNNQIAIIAWIFEYSIVWIVWIGWIFSKIICTWFSTEEGLILLSSFLIVCLFACLFLWLIGRLFMFFIQTWLFAAFQIVSFIVMNTTSKRKDIKTEEISWRI